MDWTSTKNFLKPTTKLFGKCRGRLGRFVVTVLALLILAALVTTAALAQDWTQNSFRDFREGTFLDAGSNIYVSANGRIQIINRWDLNGDGFLDIIMPSGHAHTEKEDTYVYFNNGSDIDGRSLMRVPANGSTDGLVLDLNKDGWADLAVCNGDNGITRRTDAYVYYGTRDGLSFRNRTTLPAHNSTAIAAGDFNGDGWTDLAIASQWQAGDLRHPTGPRLSFIYWNSSAGFQLEKRTTFTFDGKGATGVAAGDLDGDGRADLVMMAGKGYIFYSRDGAFQDQSKKVELPVGGNGAAFGDINGDGRRDLAVWPSSKDSGGVTILPGTTSNFSSNNIIRLEVETPREVALADFDGDGNDDVAVANHATRGGATWTHSYIYYSDGKGFASRPRTELSTLGASAVSAGDLNGDGRPELVISNERVTNQHNLQSFVYWNRAGGFRDSDYSQLDTQGSVANTIGDVNNDGRPDVVFFNFEGNFRDGASYTRIYWGNGTRNFTQLRSLDIPTHYITGLGHADLDDDGFVDLVLTQGRFVSGVDTNLIPTSIYWNGPGGFKARSNLSLDVDGGGVKVADFNRDGHLDLLVGGSVIESKGFVKRGMPIFWGGPKGFSHNNKTLIPFIEGADLIGRVPLVMDFNRDGYLDLAAQIKTGHITIWQGGADGFPTDRATTIDLGRADVLMFLNGADLNKDGWIDLILPCRVIGLDSEVTSYVYFGSSQGYSNQSRIELATYAPYDLSVADFDRDGWLDLFMNSYKGNFSRNFPSLIYWGSNRGFKQRPRTELPTYSGVSAETADYDGDGWIDIMSANHRIDGSTEAPGPHNHRTNSMLYWGGPQGFSIRQRLDLPSLGPHGMNVRDVGNSYDRSLYEDYISSAHRIQGGEKPARIQWLAETPHRTRVSFQVRVAQSEETLKEAVWHGPRGPGTWYVRSGSAIKALSGQYIQYRARLSTPNGGPTPYLTSVTIAFASSGVPAGRVDISPRFR